MPQPAENKRPTQFLIANRLRFAKSILRTRSSGHGMPCPYCALDNRARAAAENRIWPALRTTAEECVVSTIEIHRGSSVETNGAELKSPRRRNVTIEAAARRRRTSAEVEEVRHTRKCPICRNSRRALIERDFLRWRNPQEIVSEYGLAGVGALYRHAHALGLAGQRNENARLVLEEASDQGEFASSSGGAVTRGGRGYRSFYYNGRWTELPKHVVYESPRVPNQELPSASDIPVLAPASSDESNAA